MSTTNQSNQPTYTNYISLRLTIKHDDVSVLFEKVLHDVDEWCMYKHGGGTSGIAEHVHVAICGGNCERIRKRLRDNIGGGNKVYSVKQYGNDLRSFVFYCSHEGSVPDFKGDQWPALIQEVKDNGGYKKRKIDEHFVTDRKLVRDWILSYSNIVPQAVLYQKKNLPGEDSLKRVVKHMIAHTKWRPSLQMYKSGIPSVYQMDFEFRIGVRTEPDMDWWEPKQFF